MNDVSRRFNCVFTLYLTRKYEIKNQHLNGTLNLFDLAFSERLKRTETSSDISKEKWLSIEVIVALLIFL